jgi:predicted TPR repeat methyltransferase
MQRYLLAALLGEKIERAPDDYLVAYFDRFAETFESKLVGALGYRVPEDLHALLAKTGRHFTCSISAAGPDSPARSCAKSEQG